MKKTRAEMVQLFAVLNGWGCLSDLSDREKETIKAMIESIAKTAVMESQAAMSNVLHDLHQSI